jgi:hypothetical protein
VLEVGLGQPPSALDAQLAQQRDVRGRPAEPMQPIPVHSFAIVRREGASTSASSSATKRIKSD